MGKLDQFKRSNNRWRFKICYPELASKFPVPCNEWSQGSKPHSGTALYVDRKDTTFKFRYGKWARFKGLSKTARGASYGSDKSVVKADARRAERWFTIGDLVLEGGRIPGPVDTLVSKVELFVNRENTLDKAVAGRKKRAAKAKKENIIQETPEALAQRSYGSRLKYECGAARKFWSPENSSHYDFTWLECHWNKSWTPRDDLDSCDWVQCLNPPDPPEENQLMLDWDGLPVDFNGTVSYKCQSEDTYFLWDNTVEEFNVTCLNGGLWEEPEEWPECVACKYTG